MERVLLASSINILQWHGCPHSEDLPASKSIVSGLRKPDLNGSWNIYWPFFWSVPGTMMISSAGSRIFVLWSCICGGAGHCCHCCACSHGHTSSSLLLWQVGFPWLSPMQVASWGRLGAYSKQPVSLTIHWIESELVFAGGTRERQAGWGRRHGNRRGPEAALVADSIWIENIWVPGSKRCKLISHWRW